MTLRLSKKTARRVRHRYAADHGYLLQYKYMGQQCANHSLTHLGFIPSLS